MNKAPAGPALRAQRSGFTLIELLIVMAVLGVLSTVAIAGYGKYIDKSRIAGAKADIVSIMQAVEVYYSIHQVLPDDLADIDFDQLLDPWENPYEYLNFANINGNGKKRKDHGQVPINSLYDLYSKGKDGKSTSPLTAKASRDDIIMAKDGRYIGIASEHY